MRALTYHFDHVFSDRLDSLDRIDGDGASLLHTQLTFKTLLEVLLGEVKFGERVVFPLKHTDQTKKQRKEKLCL